MLAKQLATLDVLSSGRLVVGVGTGWADEEFAAAGVPRSERGRRTDEMLAALRALWGDDPVEFEGAFTRVPRSIVAPKPVQRPGPPILIGGGSAAALRRTVRYCDGWVSASSMKLDQIAAAIAEVRRLAEAEGRDPASFQFATRGVVLGAERRGPDGQRQLLSGTVDQVRGDAERYAAAGVTEFFVDLNYDPAVGAPDADPGAAMERAHVLLDAFAPAPAPAAG